MRFSTIVLVAAAVAVLVGLVLAFSGGGVPVEAAIVRTGEIRQFVDDRGKTRLPQTYLITMPYDARVEAINLTEGAPVQEGQVVARIVPEDVQLSTAAATAAVERLDASIRENDDTSVESTSLEQTLNFVKSVDRTVEAARERVKSGKARLDYANWDLERMERLQKTGAVPDESVNQAKVKQIEGSSEYQQDVLVQAAMEALQAATNLMPTVVRQYIQRKDLSHDVLEKQKAEAQVKLEQVTRDETRGEMKSPVAGVVLERAVSDERHVGAGTVLLKIGRLEDLEVEVDILSQDVVNVKPGDPADVYGPAIGKTPARAKVRTIYPAGFTKVSSLGVEQQRVKVVLDFEKQDLERLRKDRDLGVDYRVRVRIFTDQESQALVIPRSALFRGAAGDWQLFAIRGGKARLTPVEVGLMNDDLVQITRGLDNDDMVVLAPESNLSDGTRVKAQPRETRLESPPNLGD